VGYRADAGTDGSFAGNWSLAGRGICTTPLPGLEDVEATSATNSDSSKSVPVSCPAGKRVVGAGGRLTFEGTGLALNKVEPNASLTAVTAGGQELEGGHAGNWSVTVYAICANPPPGLQLVTAEGPFDSDEIQRVTADCPAGKHLLGTGGSVFGRVVLDDLRPHGALKSVTVTGIEEEAGNITGWFPRAHAICANY
jgi:hypothetical protein